MPDDKTQPNLDSALVNGAEFAWAQWGSREDPVLLLAHATGFHGRCWDQVVRRLTGFRVIALDLPGHGRSASAASTYWGQFGLDIAELIVKLGLRDVLAVGHSFGAHCLIQVAARLPERISQLIAIDPVVFAPSEYGGTRPKPTAADHVARRRNDWDSPEQMVEKFADREPFSFWQREVLRDYCRFGLVSAGNGYRLACDPAFEASIYGGAGEVAIHDLIPRVSAPVSVVRAKSKGLVEAKNNFLVSPTWPDLAAAFKDGQDIYLPEYTHFLPMENPQLVASIIQQHG